MIVGVAVYNGRVAPRCVCTDRLLLLTLRRGRVKERRTVKVSVDTPLRLAEMLEQHHVGTFVCGGLHRDARDALEELGVEIVDNVACSASDAIGALETGTLRPGYGFGPGEETTATAEPSPFPIDCLACHGRSCLNGQPCPHELPDLPDGDSITSHRMLEASADISAEPERRLCRLAELVYFCLEMEYRTIGVAFCTELTEPTEILTSVLRRFFEVVPVCCKICGPKSAGRSTGDPQLLAEVLNQAGTDLNVVVGLCIGLDCLFTQASQAPVTTLFVKDRSLANNPIGAVYSEYHIRESVAPGSPRAARAARDRTRSAAAAPESSEEEP
jgi:uncharacterized metal-binding protein/predicted Fe-Mo cluster-binding NifX family protein